MQDETKHSRNYYELTLNTLIFIFLTYSSFLCENFMKFDDKNKTKQFFSSFNISKAALVNHCKHCILNSSICIFDVVRNVISDALLSVNMFSF